MKLFVLGLMILLSIEGVKSQTESVKESSSKASARMAAEQVLKFIETGDTLCLQEILVDSILKSTPFQEFVDARLQIIERIGPVTEIESPKFVSDNEAFARLSFGDEEAELFLGFDEDGKIKELRFTPLAPDDLRPKVSWKELGKDTLRISFINEISQFKRIFQKDKGKVRLVSLLAPT